MSATAYSLPAPTSPQRILGLDGLRAISIVLVLICHSHGLIGLAGRSPSADSAVLKGRFGVEIFFVLSGYLITWLLLAEEAGYGSINLRAFYARRALRILPPAMLFLACASILGLVGALALKSWDVIPCVFFFRNLT